MTLDQIDRMVRAANPVPDPTALDAVDTRDLVALDGRRPRPRALTGAALAALVVTAAIVVGIVVVSAGRNTRDVVTPAGRPPSTTTPVPSATARLSAFPQPGALPSDPETGVLLADLPPVPVWVYEDRRVIVPLSLDGRWRRWYERRLTPEGLELVRAEISRGGRLDAVPPPSGAPIIAWFDGDRELVTRLEAPDLSWLPATAWEDPALKPFVPSRYLVCVRPWPEVSRLSSEPSVLLARLPRAAARLLAAADPVPIGDPRTWPGGATCFALSLESARAVAVALVDAAGGGQPQFGNPFSFGVGRNRAKSVEVLFNTYLPHGNPVICCAG